MRKLALTIFTITLILSTPTYAENNSHFVKRGDIYKIDIVGIIVDCGAEKTSKSELKKCFAVKFLEHKKVLKDIMRQARQHCENADNQLVCEQMRVSELITTQFSDENIIAIPTATPTPSHAVKPTGDGKWRTSSHWSAEFYYCPESNDWQGLSGRYLELFDSEKDLLSKYEDRRKLHPACK